MRSDARIRRERLLDAAADVFFLDGYSAPLDSIAARAGVGQGTLYRNFANRDELLASLLDRDLTELEQAMEGKEGKEYLFAMMECMAERWVVNPHLAEFWTCLPPDSPVFLAGEKRFSALVELGLAEARAGGQIHEDFSAKDFCLVAMMLRPIRYGADEAERRWYKKRVLALLRYGMLR